MTQYLTSPQGRRLAYNHSPQAGAPGVVFLGGFKSDMQGSKALFLEDWARGKGLSFLRFDYSGHGVSDGAFEDGSIGDWRDDARAVITALTTGPQVLVGSSMGGWISLLLAREMPQRVAGLVTIAAAPDFTTTTWDEELTEAQRTEVRAKGRVEIPSEYADNPYIFTEKLFDDGAKQRVFDQPLPLPMPTRLLQGTADKDVLPQVATRLLNHASGSDIRLTLVKGADHRFSTPDCLALIATAIDEVLQRQSAS
ncbi:alpha/beta hydrolase [Xinfangfangia sp. CPCC 101601]|uniref:Palmitoyl-protein thioesterase ABHD10, mitochondrial n=1 Tax=Pseudogemmobacter lacusdianii TaxID=3069608 RepID=A0ABU0VVE7_9RHOB|nr:alpha/beta hydrolase [Xinfangfangia sp. CPCC 101601]MDQ2065724.1 alpha/beta hydrolase [Xinfangfangia sp. CPCC 101601]